MVFFGTVLLFCGSSIGFVAYSSDDPNILIFSSTHTPESYQKTNSGVIKLEIVSFEPIQKVTVNGNKQELPIDRQLKFEIPYQLSDPPNNSTNFVVEAATDSGKAQKAFSVTFGAKPRPKKTPFLLIGIVGLTHNDNVNSVSSDLTKEAATKLVLTVVPIYTIPLAADQDLVIKGVVLREKYSDTDYEGKEVSYTQAAAQWIQKKTSFGELSADAGINDIRLKNANPLVGETETSKEVFVGGALKQKLADKSTWNVGLKYKIKDTIAEALNPNYDSDAAELKLSGGYTTTLADIKTKLKGSYTINDAKGLYMDSTAYSTSVKGSQPIDKWTPSLQAKTTTKTMAEADPLKENLIPYTTTNTLTAKLAYKLFPKSVIALELKMKNATSNVDASVFDQNLAILSFTQIY